MKGGRKDRGREKRGAGRRVGRMREGERWGRGMEAGGGGREEQRL